MSRLSQSPVDGGRGEERVSQSAGLGRRAPEVAAGAGGLRYLPAGHRPGVGGRALRSCFSSGLVAPKGTGRLEPELRSRHPTAGRRQPLARSLPRPCRHSPGLTQPLPRRPPGALVAPAAPRSPRPRAPGNLGRPGLWSPQLLPPRESHHRPPRCADAPDQTAGLGAGANTASAPAWVALAPGCSGG